MCVSICLGPLADRHRHGTRVRFAPPIGTRVHSRFRASEVREREMGTLTMQDTTRILQAMRRTYPERVRIDDLFGHIGFGGARVVRAVRGLFEGGARYGAGVALR